MQGEKTIRIWGCNRLRAGWTQAVQTAVPGTYAMDVFMAFFSTSEPAARIFLHIFFHNLLSGVYVPSPRGLYLSCQIPFWKLAFQMKAFRGHKQGWEPRSTLEEWSLLGSWSNSKEPCRADLSQLRCSISPDRIEAVCTKLTQIAHDDYSLITAPRTRCTKSSSILKLILLEANDN